MKKSEINEMYKLLLGSTKSELIAIKSDEKNDILKRSAARDLLSRDNSKTIALMIDSVFKTSFVVETKDLAELTEEELDKQIADYERSNKVTQPNEKK